MCRKEKFPHILPSLPVSFPWQDGFFHGNYQVMAISTVSGFSAVPTMGEAVSIAASCSISAAESVKSKIAAFSRMRFSWVDLGITTAPLCTRKPRAIWAGVFS